MDLYLYREDRLSYLRALAINTLIRGRHCNISEERRGNFKWYLWGWPC